MFLALWTLLGYGGGSGGGTGGGGGGYSAGYWVIIGVVAAVVIAAIVWGVMRFRARRAPATATRSEPNRTDRTA